MSFSSTTQTNDENMSGANAAGEDDRTDIRDTQKKGCAVGVTKLKNEINGLPERKSLLKKFFALLAPQLFADERVVYETQSRRPRA